MKRVTVPFFTALALAATVLITSCDWSSGSQENFNLSLGAFNVNLSGFYQGTLQGRAVANTSNGNINSFTIQQSGNRLNVRDNQGSTYTGSTSTPIVSPALQNGQAQIGSNFATLQVSFTGKDVVAGKDIEFTGTISQVALVSVNGETITTERDLVDDSDTTIDTIPASITNVVNGVTTVTTTTRTIDDTNTRNFQTNYQYQLTENNNQLRLQGTWVEIGGVVSEVDALAAGVSGSIVVNQANQQAQITNALTGGGGGGGGN